MVVIVVMSIKNSRKFIEKMYIGRCNIWVSKKLTNSNFATYFKDELLAIDVPCKLSYGTHSYSTPKLASESQTTTEISANVKLFINPDIEIPTGSKIDVIQNGRKTKYKYTGEVAFFETHQEIRLELADKYS